jgi:hypothetical protein
LSALPHFSDIDLLGYGERVINLDSEIADRALDLRVAQQELNRSKISCFLNRSALPWSCGVNECRRSMDQGRSLQASPLIVLRTAAWSDALPDRVQGRGMGYRNGPSCFPLANGKPIDGITIGCYVSDPQANDVAPTKFAIDG